MTLLLLSKEIFFNNSQNNEDIALKLSDNNYNIY